MNTKIILSLVFTATIYTASWAQIKVDVKSKVNREANQRANSKTDKVIDKSFDKLEVGIGSLFKNKEKKKTSQPEEQVQQNNEAEQTLNRTNKEQSVQHEVKWAKYDFVPGDEVIFEDGPSADEENGEFPSRWDLLKGSVEIGNVNGHNVIMFLEGGYIVPYLKNSNKDYLPEIFTIEFDVYFKENDPGRYWLHFSDHKNQKKLYPPLEIYVNGLELGQSKKRYPGTEDLNWNTNHEGKWRHISVAFTKGKLKAYMDDTRLINIPHFEDEPTGITIQGENNSVNQKYLKNIRIAKGGVKYYDRVLSEGKIIVNGIKFDVNKATLRPESMGPINGIYELMQKNPELNFSVEGHTDSDGEDNLNQTLSEARAKTVMEKLKSMGIAANRLKSTGFGESKPIGENGTAEGKANNRRVEFVKF